MTKTEKAIRLKQFRKLLKKGNTKLSFFVEYAKDWGVSEKTIARLLKEAKTDKKQLKKDKKEKAKKDKKETKKITKVQKKDTFKKETKKRDKYETAESTILRDQRIQEFIELLNFGHVKRFEFQEYARERKWEVSVDTIDRYLKAARELFDDSFVLKSKRELKRYTSSVFLSVLKRAAISGNDKLMLEAAKEMNKAFKLDEFETFDDDKEKAEVNIHTKSIDEVLESLNGGEV